MTEKADSSWNEGMLAVLLVAAVVAFNIWTVESAAPGGVRLVGGGKQGDYSNLTADGFLAGHLHLNIEPLPALVHAENPYDPARRPAGVALADLSYYKGRYYTYFGVVPVVTFFIPWRLLTGQDLSAPLAALIFVNGGFLAAAALLWRLRRRYFPASGPTALAVGILMLGLASMTYSVLRRTSIWEPPVAAGYLFSCLSLLCIYCGLHSRRANAWFAASGLLMGLATGSRPTLVVGAAAFAAPLVLAAARGPGSGAPGSRTRECLGGMLAMGLPFGAVIAGLLVYNFERFGNPLEFGVNYQLTGIFEAAARHFSASYIAFNAYAYFWAPAQWSRYFPFVEPVHLPAAPAGYYASECVYGILKVASFSLFSLVAPLALWRRQSEERAPLAAFLFSVAAYFGFVGLFLLSFYGSAARYMVDFAPALILLACVGLLSAERAAGRGGARAAVLAVAAAAAVASAAVCALLNVQLLDLLRQMNPPLYGSLARACDAPVAWIERYSGLPAGPIEITLRFPEGRVGRVEPLVTTGWESESDYLLVNYADAGHVRLGFEHAGYPVRWSDPLAVDYGADHVVRARMGSLYPPRAHPMFGSWDGVAYAAECRWLHVSVDGAVALDFPQEFYDGSPESLRIGREPTGSYGGIFTGRIRRVIRDEFEPAIAPRSPCGPVALVLSLPRVPGARRVPLLTAGRPGRADSIFVRTVGPGVVRFGYDHWGDDVLESADIALGDAEAHTLVMSAPALWADAAGADPMLRSRLFLKLDGRVLGFQEVPSYAPERGGVHFGVNAVGSALLEDAYPWAIRSVVPTRVGPLPPAGSVPGWSAPEPGSGIRTEPPAPPSRDRGLYAALWAWLVLAAWVVGRIAGVNFAAVFRSLALPAARLSSWVGRHWAPCLCAAIAAAAAVAGFRLRQSYVRAVGPMHLRIELPRDCWGRAQTLLATGRSGSGADYFVAYQDRAHIRVGADIWGSLYTSPPIAVDYAEPLDVVVNASGLYPPGHPVVDGISPGLLEALRNQTRIEVNGRTALFEPRSAYDSSAHDVTVGYTEEGFSYSEHRFTGRVLSEERLPVPRELHVGRGGRIRLRLRTDGLDASGAQPLLSIGDRGRLGVCFIEPGSGENMRLGLRLADGRTETLASIVATPGEAHVLDVAPGYVGRALPRTSLKLTLDGVPIEAPPGFIPFDECAAVSAFMEDPVPGISPHFRGNLLEASLIAAREAGPVDRAAAPLLLVLAFPMGASGADPLLVTGAAGAGDLLYVQYVDSGRVRFGFDHWGYGGPVGDAVPVDFRVAHRLELETGSLDNSGAGSRAPSPLKVVLDGVTVLDARSETYPFAAGQLSVGRNTVGGSSCGPSFRGEILVSKRTAALDQ